jgi:hypothetical protein
MRDALTHFEDWSRGTGGRGREWDHLRANEALRDIARVHWSFGYDPTADTVSLGPYTIEVAAADQAAYQLCQAIYQAAREIDKKTTADLRDRTIQALIGAGVQCDVPEANLQVSSGNDLRISLSLRRDTTSDERGTLSAQAVTALARAGLHLVSFTHPQAEDVGERLAKGEALYVKSVPKQGASVASAPAGRATRPGRRRPRRAK